MNYLPLIILYLIVFCIASIQDLKTKEVSNVYYILLISVTLLYKIILGLPIIYTTLLTAGIFLILAEVLFNYNILGGGDCKLLFALSFALGLDFSNIFILAYVIGILTTGMLYVIYWKRKGINNPPFVPIMFIWLFMAFVFI